MLSHPNLREVSWGGKKGLASIPRIHYISKQRHHHLHVQGANGQGKTHCVQYLEQVGNPERARCPGGSDIAYAWQVSVREYIGVCSYIPNEGRNIRAHSSLNIELRHG